MSFSPLTTLPSLCSFNGSKVKKHALLDAEDRSKCSSDVLSVSICSINGSKVKKHALLNAEDPSKSSSDLLSGNKSKRMNLNRLDTSWTLWSTDESPKVKDAAEMKRLCCQIKNSFLNFNDEDSEDEASPHSAKSMHSGSRRNTWAGNEMAEEETQDKIDPGCVAPPSSPSSGLCAPPSSPARSSSPPTITTVQVLDPNGPTTMMLRNIPRRCAQQFLVNELERTGFEGTYNSLYLPFSFDKRQNVGYAFINFKTAEDAAGFKALWHKTFLGGQHQLKNRHMTVTAAQVQGKEATTRHIFQMYKVGRIHNPKFQPIVFSDNGERIDFGGQEALEMRQKFEAKKTSARRLDDEAENSRTPCRSKLAKKSSTVFTLLPPAHLDNEAVTSTGSVNFLQRSSSTMQTSTAVLAEMSALMPTAVTTTLREV